jgi:hypothetical protein
MNLLHVRYKKMSPLGGDIFSLLFNELYISVLNERR